MPENRETVARFAGVTDTVFIFEKLPKGTGWVGEFEWFGFPDEIPHGRNYEKLARSIAEGLGLTEWDYDYFHKCGHPKCDRQRSMDQVFPQTDDEG